MICKYSLSIFFNYYGGGLLCNGIMYSTYYKGTFCKGLMHGRIEQYVRHHDNYNSPLNITNYKMGKRHGLYKTFITQDDTPIYMNAKGHYEDNIEHGTYTTYHPNGTVAERRAV